MRKGSRSNSQRESDELAILVSHSSPFPVLDLGHHQDLDWGMECLVSYWWLSFRDDNDDYCLGVCIVEAANGDNALQVSHVKGINPGGEAMIFELPETALSDEGLELDRLYSSEELENLGFERVECDRVVVGKMRKPGGLTWEEFIKFKLPKSTQKRD